MGNPDQQPNYAAARSTPTVDGEALYALGSDGDLACLETATGKLRWRRSLRADFGGQPGIWAYAESPLVDGTKVVCTPGGSGATVVALDKRTGETIWKCAVADTTNAAYASPIIVETGGVKQYVQLLEGGLVGVESGTGRVLWRYGKAVSRFKANIPTPVAGDGYVYAGSAGTGGGAVKLIARNGGVDAEEAYYEAKLPTTIGGSIKLGPYLYGTTGQAMVCVELATGRVKWEERVLAPASLLYADLRFYIHGENGEVALAEASPEGYREHGRFTPPEPPRRINAMEKAWAYPVVANGRLYIRDVNALWCYDVRGSTSG